LDGQRVRKSLDTANWEIASDKLLKMESRTISNTWAGVLLQKRDGDSFRDKRDRAIVAILA
jgi:hypothetical protein